MNWKVSFCAVFFAAFLLAGSSVSVLADDSAAAAKPALPAAKK